MSDNTLYYGNNIDILDRYIESESVDLVYLDPPFNSNQNYNVLFAEKDGSQSASQFKAFEDTWKWDHGTALAYQEVVENGGRVAEAMIAFRTALGTSDMLAYLAMMAPRLVEMRRALKPTGSIYLHCDPTASHYLKILLDAVFGPNRFLNEIIWKRSSAHSDTKQGMKRCGRIHDVILSYSKDNNYTWNTLYMPYDSSYLEKEYRHITDDGKRYKEADVTAARPGGETEYFWHVKRPTNKGQRWTADLSKEYKNPKPLMEYKAVKPYRGRYWAYSKQNMIDFVKNGKLIHRETGMPRLMLFVDEMAGIALQDIWDDIPPISAKAQERLGYPTQKPEALLERIIKTSTNEGDIILDPFCGCGTSIAVAQRLGRQWIGIDITHLAISLIKHRLYDTYEGKAQYQVIGEPASVKDASVLAKTDPYQFQWWTLGLVGARPSEQKKGADKGIDGRIYFHDGGKSSKTKQIILSVKAGRVTVAHLRDLEGVIAREEAEIGVLLTMQNPTGPMKQEATSAGFYDSPWGKHPKIQILTIEELLNGSQIDYPRFRELDRTIKKAPKQKGSSFFQKKFLF